MQTPGRDRKPRPGRRRTRDYAPKVDLCDDQNRVYFGKGRLFGCQNSTGAPVERDFSLGNRRQLELSAILVREIAVNSNQARFWSPKTPSIEMRRDFGRENGAQLGPLGRLRAKGGDFAVPIWPKPGFGSCSGGLAYISIWPKPCRFGTFWPNQGGLGSLGSSCGGPAHKLPARRPFRRPNARTLPANSLNSLNPDSGPLPRGGVNKVVRRSQRRATSR